MMHAFRQIVREHVIPFRNGVPVSCVLCSGFSTSMRPVEVSLVASKWKALLEVPSRVQKFGLQGTPAVISALPFNYQPRRYAGHSKWANIKNTKTANDLVKSRETTKFMNIIRVAVREQGSADPKQNSKLAQVLAQIREAKLPMASFERTLQSLQAQKDMHHCIHPIRGPGNCTMLMDIESTNLNRTKQELNAILKKHRAIIAGESVLYMFEHKGLLLCSEMDGKAVSEKILDDATEHAIESGANDVEFHEDHPEFGQVLEFVTEPSAFFKVRSVLENLKYSIVHAEVGYIPKQYLDLSDEDVEAANKLYTKLLDHQDVQKIYVNIA